jgi:dGTPase
MHTNLFPIKRFKYENGNLNIIPYTYEHFRTPYQKDYDKLVFSNSFRRLANKTQVHPLAKNDHVHNRLTHSLETASAGRSLGYKAGESFVSLGYDVYPADVAALVQASCLAHDIGNPPFGHGGEAVIAEWLQSRINNDEKYFKFQLNEQQKNDLKCFDGNAQSFRIITQIEYNLYNGGMGLSFETLASMVKYPWASYAQCKKFGYFISEEDLFDTVFSELELKKETYYLRHPISFLTEVADDICYALLDLQDGIELGIIHVDHLYNIFYKLCSKKELERIYNDRNISDANRISWLSALAINNLVLHSSYTFHKNLNRLLSGEHVKDLLSLFEDKNLYDGLKEAKNFAANNIFNESRKVELELGSYNIIGTLLNNLIHASYEKHFSENISFKSSRALTLMKHDAPPDHFSLYHKYRRVLDFIVGMTDNYATYVAHQLSGMAY